MLISVLMCVPMSFGSVRSSAECTRCASSQICCGCYNLACSSLFSGVFLVRSPVILVLLLVGIVGSLRRTWDPALRTLWLVGLALAVPIALHDFHLDRFQLPPAGFFFVLGALGWGAILDRGPRFGPLAISQILLLRNQGMPFEEIAKAPFVRNKDGTRASQQAVALQCKTKVLHKRRGTFGPAEGQGGGANITGVPNNPPPIE